MEYYLVNRYKQNGLALLIGKRLRRVIYVCNLYTNMNVDNRPYIILSLFFRTIRERINGSKIIDEMCL